MDYDLLDFWGEAGMPFSYDCLATRVKQAMELDGQGEVAGAIATRFANALRALDDSDELVLLKHVQDCRKLQCAQDGVAKLRSAFVIVRRNAE